MSAERIMRIGLIAERVDTILKQVKAFRLFWYYTFRRRKKSAGCIKVKIVYHRLLRFVTGLRIDQRIRTHVF